jgi:hypothetical protein
VDPDKVLEILFCSASDSGSNQCLQRGSCCFYRLPGGIFPSQFGLWRIYSRVSAHAEQSLYKLWVFPEEGCGWVGEGRVHVFKAWEGRGRGVASESVVINNFRSKNRGLTRCWADSNSTCWIYPGYRQFLLASCFFLSSRRQSSWRDPEPVFVNV